MMFLVFGYLLNAGLIIDTFKLDAPTETKFEHVGPYNMFQLPFLPDTDFFSLTHLLNHFYVHIFCSTHEIYVFLSIFVFN